MQGKWIAVVLVGLCVGACDDAAEHSEQAMVAKGATPARTGANTSKVAMKSARGGKSAAKSTPIDARTKREVERRVKARWGKLSSHEKTQLSRSLWRLHAALKDGPAPHLTTEPPRDPPAQQPCKDCGKKKAYPSDPCQAKRDELEELMEDAILKGLVVDTLQALKQGLVDMAFYGGVANLIADITSTAVTLATAGGGAALGRAATKALAGIALDQIKSAVVDAIADALPPPLDAAVQGELTMALLDKLIGAAEDALKEANAKKTKAIKDLNECQANYSAALKQIDSDNAAVESCRTGNPAYCL